MESPRNRQFGVTDAAAGTGRLPGKVALITGASRGIGAAVAERFASEGAHVVLVARTVGGLEERDDAIRAAGGSATLVPLDLRDFVKIDELAAALYQRYGRLDILVGNAARFGTFTPMPHVTPQEWGEILDLDLTANWRLIRAMDPLLHMAPAGRAIFVTSRLARDAPPYYGVYAAAKAGSRNDGAHLRRRGRAHRGARQSDRPRRCPHAAAGRDLSGRGPGRAARSGERDRRLCRTCGFRMHAQRRDRRDRGD